MPTVVTRYLNTGSTAGGDGTTNATSGANRAWATLEEARAGIVASWASLVASDVQVDLLCSGATDDTAAVTNTWPTSDSTRHLHIQVPTADIKVPYDSNIYTYVRNVNFASALQISVAYIKMTGIQVFHSGNLNVGGNNGIYFSASACTAILDTVKVGKLNNSGDTGVLMIGNTGALVTRNCVIGLNIGGSSFGFASGIWCANMPSNFSAFLYNNTLHGFGIGSSNAIKVIFNASVSNAVARIKNNLDQSYANGITVTNSTTNDQATNHHSTTIDATFADASNGNFRLTSADTVARNLGTDLSGVSDWPFSTDGDLTTRPVGSAWDIGAHEELTPNTPARTFAIILD